MATSSSAASLAAALGALPTEKLTRENYLLWKAQILPSLRGAEVMGLLDGSDKPPEKTIEGTGKEKEPTTVPNLAYSTWHTRDQAVLGFLFKSIAPDILAQVFDLEHTSEVWFVLIVLYSSQSKARVNMLRGALTNTKKGNMSAEKFVAKMKGFASELASAGKRIDDDELKEYILNGLDGNYNSLVVSVNAVPSTSLNDLCSQLTAFEYRQKMLAESGQQTDMFSSSANPASRQGKQQDRPYRGQDYDRRGQYYDHRGQDYDRRGPNYDR